MQPGRRRLCAALAGGALLAGWPAARAEAPRAALVIGNGAYRVGPLKNPVSDAQAMARTLRDLGFDVTLRVNATLGEMIESFRQFSLDARQASARVVYYAGHGLQVKGRNYLLPVDTEIRGEEEVAAKSADLNQLLDRLGAIKQGINILILDACRNNPFSGAEILGPDGRRLKFRGATPSGLAPVEAPLGSMVAFATAPGGVALDNPAEPHSLYTKHLLSQMRVPGLPIELVFKQVRLAVARETGRVQVPWESSSLTGDFCFKLGSDGACTVFR
jgi:carboxyl-terminal processing protease